MNLSKTITTLATFALALVAAPASLTPFAQAQHELIVDLTVPNQITITATDGVALGTESADVGEGFYLADFYTAAQNSTITETLVSGNLTSFLNISDGTPNLFSSPASSNRGLNVFSYTVDEMSDFVTGTQAFSGSATWTVPANDFADLVAGGNRGGDIFFPADSDSVIQFATLVGAYTVVVPEPSSLVLVGLGGVALLGSRRRRV